MQTTMRTHPDTYAERLGVFATYDGVTMPEWHEWSDVRTPRTDRPVRFYPAFTPGGNSRKPLHPSRLY